MGVVIAVLLIIVICSAALSGLAYAAIKLSERPMWNQPRRPAASVRRGPTYIDAGARPDRPLKPGHMLMGEMDCRHIAKHMPPPYIWCPEVCEHD